jgi:hypothetical protein
MAVHSLFYPPSPTTENGGGAASSGPGRDVLIFFISGNPGLIDYYEPFFVALRQLLDSAPSRGSTRVHIYGQDLAGFNDADHEPFSKKHPPRDVEYQIRHSLDALSRLRVPPRPGSGEAAAAAAGDKPYDDVLVMGHSVGSYIALEIFHRLVARQPDAWTEATRHLRLRAGFRKSILESFSTCSGKVLPPRSSFWVRIVRRACLRSQDHTSCRNY